MNLLFFVFYIRAIILSHEYLWFQPKHCMYISAMDPRNQFKFQLQIKIEHIKITTAMNIDPETGSQGPDYSLLRA